MKTKIIFIAMAICLGACSSSNILTKTVTQKNYNLEFTPDHITKQTINNTDVTIVPVDAKGLNAETYEAAFRDGNYEKEFISTIQNWKSKLTSVPKPERILLQGKINAFDCLAKLEKDGKIPVELSQRLKRRIIDENSGSDGTEIESLSDLENFPSDYNPYKVNTNYFSVFKLTFENKGSAIEKLNLKEFQLISDEEQLYPLALEYFENNLKDRTETIKNSYRMNMPDVLTITPGQRITKYFAVPAINSEKDKLQVQFIRDTRIVNFDFNVKRKNSERTYKLENYTLQYGGDGNDINYRNYFVINYKNSVSYALKNNKPFVSSEKKLVQTAIYAIGINTLTSEIVFGAEENFTFSNAKANKKKIYFQKVKKDKVTKMY